tara:strand:+ start:184 stop:456 length:273 start_codon:yes stop_codon:yes gene_type:complete
MPPDGRMFWVYQSMGPLEKLSRIFKAQKFYKTLSQKLDKAEQEWKDSQPDLQPQKEFIEHEPDGSAAQRLLGGALQLRFKFPRNNDNRKV